MKRLLATSYFALAGLLGGCATSGSIVIPAGPAWVAPENPAPITDAEVKMRVWNAIGLVPVHTSDRGYTRVNHAWLEATVPWSFQLLAALGYRYTENSGDCEDAAILVYAGLVSLARKAGVKLTPAVARIVVAQEKTFATVPGAPNTRHELLGVGSDRGLFVYEPQSNGAGHPRLVPLAQYPNRILSVTLGDYNPP